LIAPSVPFIYLSSDDWNHTKKQIAFFYTKIQAITDDEFIWYDMPCDQVPDKSINFKINLGPQDKPILFDIY
jgi:hypothetical protein